MVTVTSEEGAVVHSRHSPPSAASSSAASTRPPPPTISSSATPYMTVNHCPPPHRPTAARCVTMHHHASRQLIAWLIGKGADVNHVDKGGHTAIEIASSEGNMPMVRRSLALSFSLSLSLSLSLSCTSLSCTSLSLFRSLSLALSSPSLSLSFALSLSLSPRSLLQLSPRQAAARGTLSTSGSLLQCLKHYSPPRERRRRPDRPGRRPMRHTIVIFTSTTHLAPEIEARRL